MKSLINVYFEQKYTGDWSRDFSYIIIHTCADSWTTRLISNYVCQLYLFKQTLSLKVLDTYAKLID